MSQAEGGEGNTQQDSKICGMSNREISCDESSKSLPGWGLKSQTVLPAPGSPDGQPQEGDQPAVDAVQGSHGIMNDLHLWSSEERRKKINDLFTDLHSFLAHLSADDEYLIVIEEFTIFSRSLEGTLRRLEREKERMGRAVVKGGYAMDSTGALLSSQGQRFSTANFSVEIFSAPPMQGYKFCWASPNAVLSVAGRHAHISICSEKRPGLLFAIAKVLEVHNLAMVHQYVSSDSFKDVIMIHIKVYDSLDEDQELKSWVACLRRAIGLPLLGEFNPYVARMSGANGSTLWESISRMLSGSERSNSSGHSESLIPAAAPTGPEQPMNTDQQPTENDEGHRSTWVSSESVHETDWWSERDLASNLHAFLPHLPPKAEDWEIEEGAVEYIRYLRDAIQKLEMENKEASRRTPASFQPRDISKQEQTAPVAAPPVLKTWASPNVIVNMAGRDAHINICTLKRSGLLPAIADALEKRNLKMVALHVSSDNRTTIMMIHAQCNKQANRGYNEIPETRMVEEAFKSAAKEITQWISQHAATPPTSI